MKRRTALSLGAAFLMAGCAQAQNNNGTQDSTADGGEHRMDEKIIFINSSQHAEGNTTRMGKELLGSIPHRQVNLIDYRIGFLGQNLEGDQFQELVDLVRRAETLVVGTPVYWHSMSAPLKTLLDRSSELTSDNPFEGKKLYFFLQGSAPTDSVKETMVYAMTRFASQMKMDLKGTATDSEQLNRLKETLTADNS